jgi:hypothetical protein
LLVLIAVCAVASQAEAAVTLPAIAAPVLPAATAAPDVSDSYVRLTVAASFASVRSALERALAKDLATMPKDELAPETEDDENPAEGHRVEGDVFYRMHVWREPISTLAARDSLRFMAPLAFTVEAHGQGFAPVSCGTASEPETGQIGCLTRIGWSDDWGVESASSALPVMYRRLCNPSPPGVNFTKLVDARLQQAQNTKMAGLVDSLFQSWRASRQVINTGWRAMQQPMPMSLAGVALDWDPQEARAAPLVAAGDSILFDVYFRVRPRMVLADSVFAHGPHKRPLPAPRVRVASDELRVPFDFEIPCDSLASLVRAACDQEGEAVRVASTTLRAGGDRVAVTLVLRGAVEGKAYFTGRLRYDPESLRLEVPDLAPSSETEKALRSIGADPARQVRTLGERARTALRVDLKSDVTLWGAGLQKIAQRPVGEDLYLQGGMNHRDLAGVYGGPDAVGVRLVESGRVHLVRNY